MTDSTKERVMRYFWRGLIIALAVYTVVVCFSTVWKIVRTRLRTADIKRHIERLETKISRDSAFVEQIQHSPDFLEQFAREQYHMQRSGETVYILEE